MKKIFAFLLIFIVSFNCVFANSSTDLIGNGFNFDYEYNYSNDYYNTSNDDIEPYFVSAIAIPSAFGYLMATFGVVASSAIIYDNKDSIVEFYNNEIDKFKLKCTALGIASDVVENWLSNLSNGIIEKSSGVFDAFKSFLSDIFKDTSSIVFSGDLIPGVTYDFSEFGITDLYFTPTTGTTDYGNPFLVAVDSKNMEGRYNIYCISPTKGKVNFNNGVSSVYTLSNTTYSYVINDIRYYYGGRTLESNVVSYGSVPYMGNVYLDEAISKYIGADKNTGTYSNVGSLTSDSVIDVLNPGVLDSSKDVVIDWGSFDYDSVLSGVGTGSITWDDALVSGGLVVSDGDTIIGGVVEDEGTIPGEGEEDTNIPFVFDGNVNIDSIGGESVISDSSFNFEPLMALGEEFTNKFPFSLPWDLIDIIKIFDAEPVAPKFEVDFIGENIVVLDLSQFESVVKIFRFFILLYFIVGLIKITGNLTHH